MQRTSGDAQTKQIVEAANETLEISTAFVHAAWLSAVQIFRSPLSQSVLQERKSSNTFQYHGEFSPNDFYRDMAVPHSSQNSKYSAFKSFSSRKN
jgi:hypothetical protein